MYSTHYNIPIVPHQYSEPKQEANDGGAGRKLREDDIGTHII